MPYHLIAKDISLDDLRKRLETTDHIPSRKPLLDGLADKMKIMKEAGIKDVEDLKKEIGTPKNLDLFVEKTGIDKAYATLLNREINSYFPKPFPLKSFDWIPESEIEYWKEKGIKNTAQLFEHFTRNPEEKKTEMRSLCDFTRIQWTSPSAARMLYDAGLRTVCDVAESIPADLHSRMIALNKDNKYFKGNIGLRDIKRLVNSANYLKQ